MSFLLIASIMTAAFDVAGAQGSIAKKSLLENGDFELGLSDWKTMDSGIGQSSISHSVYHSDNSSLILDMLPTTAIPSSDVQGVFQSASVQDMRDMELEVWVLTPSCSLPVGTVGRLRVDVGSLSTQYDISGTCGKWQNITRNVKDDFQSSFGSVGLVLFEKNSQLPVTVALELVHTNYQALIEYASIYWDDVEVVASVPAQAAVEVSTTSSTSITETTSSQTTESVVSQETTTTLTQLLTVRPLVFGLPAEQLYEILTLVLAVGFVVSAAIVLANRIERKMPNSRTKSPRERCPECGARIPPYHDATFCQECGAKLG